MYLISILQSSPTFLIALVAFALIIACYALGYNRRNRLIRKYPNQAEKDTSTMTGTLLALLGLMLAFSFSMANSRYDARRQVMVEEANVIGTAILRTQMYPDSVRRLLRAGMKEYVEVRIGALDARRDKDKLLANQIKTDSLSKQIWNIVSDYTAVDPTLVRTSELIPALNDMIDIFTTRRAAFESTIPDSIMFFLLLLCLSSSFLLAQDRKTNADWIVVVGFSLMLSATIFTIIDLDRPHSGLISMERPQQKIEALRGMFDAD